MTGFGSRRLDSSRRRLFWLSSDGGAGASQPCQRGLTLHFLPHPRDPDACKKLWLNDLALGYAAKTTYFIGL